jgi:branched-chain amino acid transport system substrate-binding protein
MKTRKLGLATFTALLILLPLLVACGTGAVTEAPADVPADEPADEPSDAGDTTMAEEEHEILKIGFAMDLTGPGAEWFVPFADILELEIDRINSEGGIEVAGTKYDLELIKETTNLTPEGAKAAAEALMFQHDVNIMWGAGILDETMALQDVTEPNNVLNLSACFGQECLSGALVDGEIVDPYTRTIAIVASSRETQPGLWRWVRENYPDYTRVADITIDTIASHWAFDEVESKILPVYGFESVVQEFYETGQTDFYAILTRVLEEDPHVIHCSNSPPNEWALMMKQAREMGFEGIFVREEMGAQNLIDIAGAENVETLVGWDYPTSGDAATPEYLDLKERYIERYGEWSAYGPVGVRMLPVLIQAMQQAGTVDDVDKIIDTLISNEWTSYGQEMRFCGEEYYGIPHLSITPLVITQAKDGEFAPVGEMSIEDQCEFWEQLQ